MTFVIRLLITQTNPAQTRPEQTKPEPLDMTDNDPTRPQRTKSSGSAPPSAGNSPRTTSGMQRVPSDGVRFETPSSQPQPATPLYSQVGLGRVSGPGYGRDSPNVFGIGIRRPALQAVSRMTERARQKRPESAHELVDTDSGDDYISAVPVGSRRSTSAAKHRSGDGFSGRAAGSSWRNPTPPATPAPPRTAPTSDEEAEERLREFIEQHSRTPLVPPGTTATFNVDQELLDPYASLPFAPAQEELSIDPTGLDDRVMSTEESSLMWGMMFVRWGLLDRSSQQYAASAVMAHLMVNGTSTRSDMDKTFHLNGRDFAFVVVSDVLGWKVRRFARANARYAYDVYRANPAIRYTLAQKYNIPHQDALGAIDFVEYFPNVPKSVRVLASDLRNNRLPQHQQPNAPTAREQALRTAQTQEPDEGSRPPTRATESRLN